MVKMHAQLKEFNYKLLRRYWLTNQIAFSVIAGESMIKDINLCVRLACYRVNKIKIFTDKIDLITIAYNKYTTTDGILLNSIDYRLYGPIHKSHFKINDHEIIYNKIFNYRGNLYKSQQHIDITGLSFTFTGTKINHAVYDDLYEDVTITFY